MSENELIPDLVVESIKEAEMDMMSPVQRYYLQRAKELGRWPEKRDYESDPRHQRALLEEDRFKNDIEAKRDGIRWRIYQLQNLGEWVLRHVGTWHDRYGKEASFRDLSQMFPTRVYKDEVRATVEHLVKLGLVEKFKWQGSRGPSTVRYRLSEDGATLMAGHLEEPTYGSIETEPDEPVESDVDAGAEEPESAARETERRVGPDGEAEEDSEGGYAWTAKPGDVARRRAGPGDTPEERREARPHGDATGVEA